MSWGLPYLGSKNIYAKYVVSVLPPGNRLVDLFAGGCAIADCALKCFSDKYNSVLINDINPEPINLYWKCLRGKNPVPYKWISRESFKKQNWSTRLVWSFGSNLRSYIYGQEVEIFKKDVLVWIFNGKNVNKTGFFGGLPELATKQDRYGFWLKNRNDFCKSIPILRSSPGLQSLENLERLQSLENLERLQSLEKTCISYTDYRYMIGDVVYCDIPYAQTETRQYEHGGEKFDHKKFWEWASTRFFDVYVSERRVPEYAEVIMERSVPCRASRKGTDKMVTEYLVRVGGRCNDH